MKKFYLIAAAALMLAACSEEDDCNVAVRFTANIDNAKATRALSTTWEDGDAIGITATTNTSMSKYQNYKYTTAAGSLGDFTADAAEAIYFQNDASVDFTAYYPYSGTNGMAAGTLANNTRAVNQTADAQKQIDYLFAPAKSASEASPTVNFVFSHKMSKIELTFQSGDDIDISEIESYTISGLKMEGTFNTADGTATAISSAAEDLTISTTAAASSVIIYPQEVTDVALSVTVDGQAYKCSLISSTQALAAGNKYVYTITVNKTGLKVASCSISDWETGASNTGTAEM